MIGTALQAAFGLALILAGVLSGVCTISLGLTKVDGDSRRVKPYAVGSMGVSSLSAILDGVRIMGAALG